MTEEMRMESDLIGTMEVPKEAYYGVQALRAKQNFPITGQSLHPVFIRNLAKVKKAAAQSNRNALALPADKAEAIIRACDEVIRGCFTDEFIVDADKTNEQLKTAEELIELVDKYIDEN